MPSFGVSKDDNTIYEEYRVAHSTIQLVQPLTLCYSAQERNRPVSSVEPAYVRASLRNLHDNHRFRRRILTGLLGIFLEIDYY
jgi:hypothetical protein